jgi:hypothetical protein
MAVDLNRFTEAVEQLNSLREQHHLRVEVTPQGSVSLVFDEVGAAQAPQGGDGLYIDIEDVATAIAAGATVDEFVRRRQSAVPGPLEPEDEATARSKYELVASGLSAGLQRRAWLRTTSKVYVLTSHDWEVVSKLADSSSRPRPADASESIYGLLRLNTERAAEGQPDQKVTVFGLDADDLDDLIRSLTSLSAALAAETGISQRGNGNTEDG